MLITRWVIVSANDGGSLTLNGPFMWQEEASDWADMHGLVDRVITTMEGPL